ncbi:MAG: HAMP domain-containing histidine kinase [Tidjanibacter sp.]|nr:HAMP domain-containing histidine kinase [Tidjanibacter sp.]
MKSKMILLLAALFCCQLSMAQEIDTAFMQRLPKVDIYGEQFNKLVDSLTVSGNNEELFGVMFAAGRQAESLGDVRLQAIYYDKAAGYAQTIDNKTAMVVSILRSSEANRQRNYAGTSIRQLATVEKAVAEDADLLYMVNEAQIVNFEALGDIGSAYKYMKKVADYREQLAERRLQQAVSEAEIAAEEKYAPKKEQPSEREIRRAERAARWADKDSKMQLYVMVGGGTIIVLLVVALLMVAVRGWSRRKKLERRFEELLISIPKDCSERAEHLRLRLMTLVTAKNKESDEFKQALDEVAYDVCRLSSEVSHLSMSNFIMQEEFVPEMEETDVDKILKQSQNNIKDMASLKNIDIDYKSTGSCKAICDARSLEMMIDMFIMDALESVRIGGKVSLWIESDGKAVTIAVEDDGDKNKFAIAEMILEEKEDLSADSKERIYARVASLNGAKLINRSKKEGGTIRGISFSE